jgi:hypothetical protein
MRAGWFNGLCKCGFKYIRKTLYPKVKAIDLTLTPEVRDEKNTWNSDCVWFGRCINGDSTGSEAREG